MRRGFKFAILIVYYVVSIIIGVIISYFSKPICLQENCVDKSSFIMNKMDTKVSPCKDFYQFMCGSARQTPPPNYNKSKSKKNRDDLNEDSIFKYMLKKVSNYAGATRTGSLQSTNMLFHESLLYKFFTMCDSVKKTSDQATMEDVKYKLQLVAHHTGMSLRDIPNAKRFNTSLSSGGFEYRLRIAGFPAQHFYSAEVKRDHNDPDNIAMYLDRGHSFRVLNKDTDLQRNDERGWTIIYQTLVHALIPSAPVEDITYDVGLKMASLMFAMGREVESAVEDKAVKDEAVKLSVMQKRFPDLDIREFVRRAKDTVDDNMHVYIKGRAKNYFDALQRVLKRYTRHVKVVYQLFMSLMDVAIFLHFENTNIEVDYFHNIESFAHPENPCRLWIGHQFNGMVMSLIVERFQLERNPPDILNLVFSRFEDVMESWLHKSSWMDSKTKAAGVEKLKAMKLQISLTKKQYDSMKTPGKRAKFYNGLCIQRSVLITLMCMSRFFAQKNIGLFSRELTGFDDAEAIAMGDISYEQTKNLFQVPIFILRFPAFDGFWPVHVNFGGLGVEISTELSSGFDLAGSRHDKFGMERSWWTNQTMENYKRKEISCSKVLEPVAKKFNHTISILRLKTITERDLEHGELTRGYWKNVVGLKMAFKAYMDYYKAKKYRDKFLPGLEMYTRQQNFFFSHAHMRCLPPNPTRELLYNSTLYFEAISNLEEFKQAFKCPKKSHQVTKATSSCVLF